jgi:hypothetical protein
MVSVGFRRQRIIDSLKLLDSNNRYVMLYTLYEIHRLATNHATVETTDKYRSAFAAGTLKKRKQRGGNSVKVWIDNDTRPAQPPLGAPVELGG